MYLFHGDGFIREAALNALAAPIRLPVVAYELMRRMNDWAPEVRAAAWSAIARCFRQTDPSVLAPAAWIVLLDARSWGRWQEGYFRLLDELFEHPGLFSALIMRLLNESRNGSGTVFRALCQSTEMDRCLVDLAARARQPHLRAGALNCISSGKVVWPLGKSRKVWVDKSLGEYKVVADYGSRPLSVHLDLESILEQALRDRSAAVRKEALDALILHRRDPRLRVLISHCLEAFAKDPRPSVRSRLEYLERNLPKLP
ncbi:hypothetical protein [Frigidibacter mobilis]|uniref:hypothetical protein n=1 Tax=Frigidibacter mobilis TaxID=1335048 RepID=UPI0014136F2F|nr:hypothetical protein [Frigidibacter mobilis]